MMNAEDFNILIVDDEKGIRDNFAMLFEMNGFTVHTASGGKEAFGIVEKTEIHFVISDVRMPEGDGETLLQTIRKTYPDVPAILMVTGFAELTKEQAIKQGAIDLLNKPVDFEVLEEHVMSVFQNS